MYYKNKFIYKLNLITITNITICNAEYIKKWLPQLKDIPAKELHEWDKYCDNYDLKEINYVKPIVDYKTARQKSVKMYRDVL